MLNARQEMDRVLSGLAALVGASLSLDDDGVIAIEFEDDITATIEVPANTDQVFLHLTVARLPREGREALLAAVLRRNLFGLDIADAWLATDAAGEELLLCRSLRAQPTEMDNFPETLAALIAEVGGLRLWLRESAAPRGDGSGKPTPQPAPAENYTPTLFFRG